MMVILLWYVINKYMLVLNNCQPSLTHCSCRTFDTTLSSHVRGLGTELRNLVALKIKNQYWRSCAAIYLVCLSIDLKLSILLTLIIYRMNCHTYCVKYSTKMLLRTFKTIGFFCLIFACRCVVNSPEIKHPIY